MINDKALNVGELSENSICSTNPQNDKSPMKAVQTTAIPTKLEFAQDQNKDNNKTEGE
ncbi:hypothetical protein [Dehalobacter sp.]|uniref:hypothetical protein n=1 Tax=Dehalobacter sp. TaxID=1962289 RepID=UPI00258EF119|nr:hypothetical protein [Dehalobacter sp.]MDJ0306795.1 hypothetical protein [Dehalobacter sp.]